MEKNVFDCVCREWFSKDVVLATDKMEWKGSCKCIYGFTVPNEPFNLISIIDYNTSICITFNVIYFILLKIMSIFWIFIYMHSSINHCGSEQFKNC